MGRIVAVRRRAALAGLTLALAFALMPGVAAAGPTPVDLGPGTVPSVTVGPDSTAYIAYFAPSSSTAYFCRLPRGATACAGGQIHFTPSDVLLNTHVLRSSSGQIVVLATAVTGPTFTIEEWTSGDGGATWSPSPSGNGRVIGSPVDVDTSGDDVLSPDGSGAELINGTSGQMNFQFDPLDGSGAGNEAEFTFPLPAGAIVAQDGTLASTPSLTVAAYLPNSGGSQFSVYSGAPGPAMDSGGWSAPSALDPSAVSTHLTQGSAGIGLAESLCSGGGPCQIVYRRFDGASSFGAPVTVSANAGAGMYYTAAAQDSSGRVHMVWSSGIGGNTIFYDRSDDGGSTWRAPVALVNSSIPSVTGVGAAPDGQGWVVYYGDSSSGGVEVFAAPLQYPRAGTAPVTSGFRQSARRWRRGSGLPHISSLPVGTKFSFSLNEAASVTLSFARSAPGRKVGQRCVAASRANRHHRACTRLVAAGKLSFAGHAGANRIRFYGRLSRHHALAPGKYVVSIQASANGLRSAMRTLKFSMVR